MDELERYLRESYRGARREVGELGELITEVSPVFLASWNADKKEWPYGVPIEKSVKKTRKKTKRKKKKYSYSTNAMILFMLALATDKVKSSSLVPTLPDNPGFKRLVKEAYGKWDLEQPEICLDKGRTKLFTNVCRNARRKKGEPYLTYSSTYGHDDVLTLTWLSELVYLVKSDKSLAKKGFIDEIEVALRNAAKQLKTKTVRHKLRCFFHHNKDHEKRKSHIINEHAFPLLRMVQLLTTVHRISARDEKLEPDVNRLVGERVRLFFEDGLHQHLAYKSIPESRFDPAELIFCLEGALRFPASNISDEAIVRALEVIGESEDDSPYWRSIKPTIATPQGEVLLPIGVEVANSLLRTCRILDGRNRENRYFHRCVPMFRRYVRWLKAQKTSVQIGKTLYFGWQSEHVGREEKIDLWQTSEILVFLMNYQLMFQEDVARTMKDSSSILTKPETIDARPRNVSPVQYWNDGAAEKGNRAKKSKANVIFTKRDIGGGWKKGEPILYVADDSKYAIYELLEKRFIGPRDPVHGAQSGDPHYSILLYGPPGTGKTTLCEELAKALGWELIIVTPSDFLAGGAAEVEARAKAIFTMLERQKDKVILLDEIDHFLLDRGSEAYEKQQGIFQFMTPGMLPKLNDLRSAESSIFVIATNYAERIDSAVKRRGRVDDHFILLPPGLDQRLRILKQPVQKEAEHLFQKKLFQTPTSAATRSKNKRDLVNRLEKIARKTPLYSWTELKHLVEEISAHGPAATMKGFMKHAENAVDSIHPTIRLSTYVKPRKKAFEKPPKKGSNGGNSDAESEPEWSKPRTEEVLLLVYLRLEAICKAFGGSKKWRGKRLDLKLQQFGLSGAERADIPNALSNLGLKDYTHGDWPTKIRKIVDDKHVADRLIEFLPKLIKD